MIAKVKSPNKATPGKSGQCHVMKTEVDNLRYITYSRIAAYPNMLCT
jgi:hypothetical protein